MTNPITDTELDELIELEKRATPGEWKPFYAMNSICVGSQEALQCREDLEKRMHIEVFGNQREENARLISKSKTFLPRLIEAYREQMQEIHWRDHKISVQDWEIEELKKANEDLKNKVSLRRSTMIIAAQEKEIKALSDLLDTLHNQISENYDNRIKLEEEIEKLKNMKWDEKLAEDLTQYDKDLHLEKHRRQLAEKDIEIEQLRESLIKVFRARR